MAVRLSIALNTSSKMWLSMQDTYDLWQVEQYKVKLLEQVSTVDQYHSYDASDSGLRPSNH